MHSTQERRAARRELKTLAKSEAVSEEEQAARMAELDLREQEELWHSQLCDTSQVTKRSYDRMCFVVEHGRHAVSVSKAGEAICYCGSVVICCHLDWPGAQNMPTVTYSARTRA